MGVYVDAMPVETDERIDWPFVAKAAISAISALFLLLLTMFGWWMTGLASKVDTLSDHMVSTDKTIQHMSDAEDQDHDGHPEMEVSEDGLRKRRFQDSHL